jgi:hypothetical protein
MFYQFRDRVDGNYVVFHNVNDNPLVLSINRDEYINFISVKAYEDLEELKLYIYNEEKCESKGEELAIFTNIKKGLTKFYLTNNKNVNLTRSKIIIENNDNVKSCLIHFIFGIIQI